MNHSISYHKDSTATTHRVCSEKTCITCFENRGCIYEQYLIAPANNVEEPHLVKQTDEHNSAIKKRKL